MRAFGIISLFTALAVTLCVSAAPGPIAGLSSINARDAVIPGGVSSGNVLARSDLQTGPLDIVERELAPVPPTPERRDLIALPTIVTGATGQIQALIPNLDALVAAQADVQAFVNVLLQVKTIIVAAVAAVQVLINANVSLVVALEGQAIADVAILIVALIQIVLVILVKITAVVALNVPAIATVVADISAQLVILLQLCLQISLSLVVVVATKAVLLANIGFLVSLLVFLLLYVIL